MKKIIFAIVFISRICFADDPKIIVVNKDQLNPYDGILLNKEAAVSLKVEFDSLNDKCNLTLQEQKEKLNVTCNYDKTIINNECDRQKKDLNIKLETSTKELELYKNKIIEEQNKANSNYWSGTFIGAAGGVLVTSIVGLAIYMFK